MATRLLLIAASLLLALGCLGCDELVKRLLANMAPGGSQATAGTEAGSGSRAKSKRDPSALSLDAGEATRLYYQFIDERSQVRFVERLEDVPAIWRSRVGYVEMAVPPPLSPMQARNTRRSRHSQTYKTASVSGKLATREVLLYYADWCSWCKKAKSHLKSRGVAFTLRDIDVPSVLAELVEKTGQKGIPVIDIDGRILKGFNPGRLDELLRQSG